MGEKSGWKRHFTKEKFSLEHQDPTRFVHGPWRQKPRVSVAFLLYRLIYAAALLGALLWSMVLNWHTGKWFIYLTHWGFGMCAIYAVMGAVLVVAAFVKQGGVVEDTTCLDSTASMKMPVSYKIYWLIYNIMIPGALFITILYWALIYDPIAVPELSPLNYTVHMGNSIAVLVELFLGGLPSRLLHVLQPIIFGFAYLGFNGIYWVAGGTDPKGNPWVYEIMNWDNLSTIGKLLGSCIVLILLLHIFVTICAGIRSWIANKIRNCSQKSREKLQLPNMGTFTPKSLSMGMSNKGFESDFP